MKDRIKLKLKKLMYWFDYNIGHLTVNGNKYDSYLRYLANESSEISVLEEKIKNKIKNS